MVFHNEEVKSQQFEKKVILRTAMIVNSIDGIITIVINGIVKQMKEVFAMLLKRWINRF